MMLIVSLFSVPGLLSDENDVDKDDFPDSNVAAAAAIEDEEAIRLVRFDSREIATNEVL